MTRYLSFMILLSTVLASACREEDKQALKSSASSGTTKKNQTTNSTVNNQTGTANQTAASVALAALDYRHLGSLVQLTSAGAKLQSKIDEDDADAIANALKNSSFSDSSALEQLSATTPHLPATYVCQMAALLNATDISTVTPLPNDGAGWVIPASDSPQCPSTNSISTVQFSPTADPLAFSNRITRANNYMLALAAQAMYPKAGTTSVANSLTDIQDLFLSWKFHSVRSNFTSDGTAVALVAKTDGLVVVAFQGTSGRASALNNFDFGLKAGDFFGLDGQAKIHGGFADTLEAISQTSSKNKGLIDNILDATSDGSALWITGHSRGGAMALLTGLKMASKTNKPVNIVTFGAPRTGNSDFTQKANSILTSSKSKFLRFDNEGDIIPHLCPTQASLKDPRVSKIFDVLGQLLPALFPGN